MNRIIFLLIMSATILASSCNSGKEKPLINKQYPKIENGIMSPEILWSFGRLGSVNLSANKSKLLYTVSYYSVEENKSNTEVFTINIDGSDKRQITHTPVHENSPRMMKYGKHIAFLSSEGGDSQLWMMRLDGSGRKQISNREGGINGFLFSPDESKILFFADVKVKSAVVDVYPDLPQATGIIAEDLMYKHWDEWVSTTPHPFLADFDGKTIANEIDLLEGEPYESPSKPFGGIDEFSWSPDGKVVAYTSRKKTGKEYAISTNTNIYFYDVDSGETVNMTEGMMGYDTNPRFSPDGKWLAWQSMERDGYESDKQRLFIMNLETKEKIDLTANFDQSAEGIAWEGDSENLYFISVWHAVTQIYKVNIKSGDITQITEGVHDYIAVYPAKDRLIGVKCSMSKPHEIYAVDIDTGEEQELSLKTNIYWIS